jgi:tripartite-type tricarboxylate transporter receptor subunit TctC
MEGRWPVDGQRGPAGATPHAQAQSHPTKAIRTVVPFVLTANPSMPAKDLKELATLLRGNASLKYNFGSTGPGSAMHVLGEAYKREAKVSMEHGACGLQGGSASEARAAGRPHSNWRVPTLHLLG